MSKSAFIFLLCILQLTVSKVNGQVADDIFSQRALSLDALVKEKQRYVDQLDEKMNIDLPVGIRKTIGNIDYTVIVDSISFTREGGFLTSYLVIKLPGADPLCFRGNNIRFTSQGGLSGSAELQLLGNRSIKIGKGTTLQLNGDGTKAIWDCEGFKMVSLDGVVVFDRSILLPENRNGDILEGEVTASVRTDVIDFSNLIVEMSIDGFQLPQLPGFGIHAERVVLDMSDVANATSMYFPKVYRDTYKEDIGMWRGLSFRNVRLYLPSFISRSGDRVEIAGQNLLLDDFGISGAVEVSDILSLGEGALDSWAISVDDLRLRLLRNQVKELSLTGGLTLPIMKEGSDFRYRARLDEGNELRFMVASEELIEIPAFGKAQMMLYPSSRLFINTKDDKAEINTRLSGKLLFAPDMESDLQMEIGEIEFQDLKLNSSAPYISGGVFDLSGINRSVAGFPVNLNAVGFRNDLPEATELELGLGVGLSKESQGVFSGQSKIVLKINTEDQRRFRFGGIVIDKVKVDIDGGAFKMRGLLAHFNEDNVYGSGFRGAVDAVFAPDIKVEADLLFGKKEEYRFFYVSGSSLFPAGIPFAGGVALYGFSGGAMNKMRVEVTESGYLRYLPDPGRGLGFRAGVAIGTSPNRKAFNAEANLQMIFNPYGGLSEMTVEGIANFMEPPASVSHGYLGALSKSTYSGSALRRGQVSGDLLLYYNAGLKTFHGNIKVFANVVDGAIRGSGQGNLAGEAVLHFSPTDWYVHIGTPSNRIGLLFGLEQMNVEADAYFMAGTQVPESPPPPDIVGSILGDSDLDYMRDINALGKGQGFAFGSSFSMDTGEKQFLLFFARLQAGIGFDVMMKDYGNDIYCSGQEDILGVNGWYANGQAYGYFQGAIGIKVDLPFASGKYKIMDIGSAILLQAQLPNPTWMKGTVGGYYELLNGLVKGNCRFRLEIGKKCDLGEYSSLQGLKVISAMTPVEGQNGVDVFISPQVAFNLPVNEAFKIKDINDNEYEYRIDIEDVSLYQNGLPVSGDLKLNYDKTVAALQTSDILTSEMDYTFKASVLFMERSGNRWKPLVRAGKPVREEKQIEFTSGIAPDYIPKDNIEYSYPVAGDAYFFSGYGNKGYLKLKKGQPELFPEKEMEFNVNFLQEDLLKTNTVLTYQNRLLEFDIPDLQNGAEYQLQFVSNPIKEIFADQNLTNSYVEYDASTQVLERNLSGTISLDGQNTLLEYEMKTSRYARLSSKVPSWTVTSFFLEPGPVWYLKNLVTKYGGEEMIGADEVSSSGVIKVTALLGNSTYYNDDVYPLVYDGYPLGGDIMVDRDTTLLGLPPVRAVVPESSGNRAEFSYNLTPVMARDFLDIQKQVVRRYINQQNVDARYRQIILRRYPVVMYGNFDLTLQYHLPGTGQVVDRVPLRFYLPKEY